MTREQIPKVSTTVPNTAFTKFVVTISYSTKVKVEPRGSVSPRKSKMPGHQNSSTTRVVDRSSSFSHSSDVHDSPLDAAQAEIRRSPLRKPSAKFDTQVASLPIRFQAMTRITEAEISANRVRMESQRSTNNTGNRTEEEDGRRPARKLSRRDQRRSKAVDGSLTSGQTEQPVGLVVALFHDGFVCRHINKENEGVEGFAQPYDTESSYFLACIDNGRVPEGLPDMIACSHYNGSVLAEIHDYRDMGAAMCPVSSAFLPAASALPQEDDTEPDAECCIWQTLLLPGKSPSPINAHVSQFFETPTLQSLFDHFPDVTPSELETLAMDAKRQLLQEEDVLLSSSSTESSSPRDESRGFGFFPAEPEEGRTNGENEVVGLRTTPSTRSHSQGGLEVPSPASVLSPIQRKSARSTRKGQEVNSAKRCKRQIQTKAKTACNRRDSQKSKGMCLKSGSGTSRDQNMEICESSRNLHPQPGKRGCITEDSAAVTPLPATQLFLSRLKGKRRRPDNELLYGKPAWVTIAHVGRFFRAATRLEREHSRFLHVNAQRLMQVERLPPTETQHVAGSMRYLARQLGNLTRPSDVIAVSGARELKAAEDEGRELVEPDWTDNGEGSTSSVRQPAKSSTALVTPDSEPALLAQHRDTEDIMLGQFFDLATETTNLVKDYQPTAGAPHFNVFDDDGNLQLTST